MAVAAAAVTTLCYRNNKYYTTAGDVVAYSPTLSGYAPGDTVALDAHCRVTALVNRQEQTTPAVVRGKHVGATYFYCPLLGTIFNPAVTGTAPPVGDRVLLHLAASGQITVIKEYGSCHNRAADWQIIDDVYSAAPEPPAVEFATTAPTRPLYTQPYRDQTALNTFTIDPADSRDFDDAISVEGSTVYVHIVDAATQILPGSVADREAARLAFTLYLAEGNHNILPKNLAEHVLSLVEGEPRRVITVEIRFWDGDGSTIKGYDIYPATIVVKKRHTYATAPHMPFLAAIAAAAKRHHFTIPQVVLDVEAGTGELMDISHVYNTDEAHRIVETLMVLANMLVSKHLQESGEAAIPQRYHTKLRALPEAPAAADPIVNSFLAIKSFAQASYEAGDASGHFGLGLSTYTHFTSPIRRYFDVIIHRLLAGQQIDQPALEELLAYINGRERLVEGLQRLYKTWKIVGAMEAGEVWPSVAITKVVPAGIYYLETERMMDGFIHVSRLGGEGRWTFADGMLCCDKQTLRCGDVISCRIEKVDHITGTVLLSRIEG